MDTGSNGSRRNRPHRPRVSVLRIGHRAGRDPRLTTHLALAARALGADRMYLHPPDPSIAERIAQVDAGWGGRFEVVGVEQWKPLVRSWPGAVVHLTMYGLPLSRVEPKMRTAGDLLVVVGGAKVPSELYSWARFNVAVGHEPHSEVAALAVLLDHLLGLPPPGPRAGAARWVRPRAHGKAVSERRSPP